MGKPVEPRKVAAIIADWRTGKYKQRDLAEKYKLSNGYIAKITKGIDQDNKDIVSQGVDYYQALEGLREQGREQEITAVIAVVEEKVQQQKWLNTSAMRIAVITMEALEKEPTVFNANIAQKTMIDTHKAAGLVGYYPQPATTNINASSNAQAAVIRQPANIIFRGGQRNSD
jgi:hypothetical protein